MKYLVFLLGLFMCINAKAQFPGGTDTLRRFNNRFIDNDAKKAFTNLRLHNLLAGIIDQIDSAAGGGSISLGLDTLWAQNDSTLIYRKNGLFYTVIVRGATGAGLIYRVPFSDGAHLTNDSNFLFDKSQGADASRLIVGPTTISSGGLAKINATSDNMNALALTSYGTGLNTILFRRARGSIASPTGLLIDDDLFNLSGRGYTGSLWTGSKAAIYGRASQNWTDTTNGTRLYFATTTNDSVTMETRMIMDDSVQIRPVISSIFDSIAAFRGSGNGLNTILKVPFSGNSFIQNQFSSAQSGSFYIDSLGRVRYLKVDSFATFQPISAPAYTEGGLFYDNDNKTFTVYDDITGTSVQLSQETILRARNNTGSTILEPKAVYLTGAIGQNPTIGLAKADVASTARVIGLATNDIANNTVGKVCIFGLVNKINTSAFSDGDKLYLSPTTAGGLTAVEPSSPNLSVFVGYCVFSHNTNGKILVDPQKTIPSGGAQNLQQTFDQGATLTKHNKIINIGNRLVTTGQVINNNDTTTSGWVGSQLVYGTSIDRGVTVGGDILITNWVQQTSGALGLFNDDHAISGTTLKHVSGGDNCMEDLLPTIANWNSSIKYIVIGTYPVNDVQYIDSATYRTALSAMIDSLHLNRGYPLSSILVLNGTPAPIRGSGLPLLAASALHTAMEKGTRYFDSYNYLKPDPSNIASDSLHLNIKGQYNLANGILNSVTTYDSVNYVRANNIQAEQAISVNGKAYMYGGYLSTSNDSTTGNQAIGGNLSLYGNFIRSATFKSSVIIEDGLNVTGGGGIGNEWNLYNNPSNNNLKFGIKMEGANPFFTDIYTGHNISSNGVRLGWMGTDGTTFTPNLTALQNGNILIGTSTDNTIGKLQVNGKATIATIDSTATAINMLYQGASGEVFKSAVPAVLNFFNTDLTQTANRSHNAANFTITVDTIKTLDLIGRGLGFQGKKRFNQLHMDATNSNDLSDFMYMRHVWRKGADDGDSATQQIAFNGNTGLRLEHTNHISGNGSSINITETALTLKAGTNLRILKGTPSASADSIWGAGTFSAGGNTVVKIPRGIASVNSMTNAAITISAGPGISTSSASGDVEISVATTSSSLPHTLDKKLSSTDNTSTTETDLYSYTVPANKLLNNGNSFTFDVSFTLNDVTATADLRFYFAGTVFGNTGALTVSATGAGSAHGYVQRLTSTTALASVTVISPGASTATFTANLDLTSLDFTTTNIFKVTGQAGGAGGGTGDITLKPSAIMFWP